MRQDLRPTRNFNGSDYGDVFSLDLQGGKTLDALIIEATNVNDSQMGNVELLLNGSPIVSVPMSHFKDLMAAEGEDAQAGVWRINFKDESMCTDMAQVMGALATYYDDEIVLNINIGAGTTAQTDAGKKPILKALAKWSASKPRVFIPMIKRANIATGVSGENTVGALRNGSGIKRVYFEDGERITQLRVTRGDSEIMKVTREQYEREYKHVGKTVLANKFIFNPVMTGFGMSDMLKTAGERVEFYPTLSDAGDMNVIIHELVVAENPQVDPVTLLDAVVRQG